MVLPFSLCCQVETPDSGKTDSFAAGNMNRFSKEVLAAFAGKQAVIRQLDCSPYSVLCFDEEEVFVQLVSLADFKRSILAEDFFSQLTSYFKQGKLITIWEDQWIAKKQIIVDRLKAMLGTGKKIHGRKTIVRRIDKATAEPFFEQNHLMGYVSAYFKLGLFFGEELVAAALFSKGKNFVHDGKPSRSHELVRFANAGDTNVVGGFTKLLNAFYELEKPNDMMTYLDRNWSDGKNYLRQGFTLEEMQPPQTFLLDTKTMQRHSLKRYLRLHPELKDLNDAELLAKNDLQKIYNSGNLKMRKRY